MKRNPKARCGNCGWSTGLIKVQGCHGECNRFPRREQINGYWKDPCGEHTNLYLPEMNTDQEKVITDTLTNPCKHEPCDSECVHINECQAKEASRPRIQPTRSGASGENPYKAVMDHLVSGLGCGSCDARSGCTDPTYGDFRCFTRLYNHANAGQTHES